jgi:hypothetical protein
MPDQNQHRHHHHRQQSLSKKVKKGLKGLWRKYWSILLTVLFGLITAFYVIPSLYKFFTEAD